MKMMILLILQTIKIWLFILKHYVLLVTSKSRHKLDNLIVDTISNLVIFFRLLFGGGNSDDGNRNEQREEDISAKGESPIRSFSD